MSKIKLCICGDFTVQSGFARCLHSLAEYLYDTDEYEIYVVGINYKGEPNYWSKKYDVYPAGAMGNWLGGGIIGRIRKEIDPDVWFMWQDHWNLYQSMLPEVEGARGVIISYPLDSPNIIPNYIYGLTDSVHITLNTNFAIRETIKSAKVIYNEIITKAKKSRTVELFNVGAKIDGRTLNINTRRIKQMAEGEEYSLWDIGIDTKKFYPMDKEYCRDYYGLPKDKHIVGYVSNNDYRKRNWLLLQALQELPEDTVVLLHCAVNCPTGWNLPQLADYYGVRDRVIFSHDLIKSNHPQHPFNDDQLRILYNCMDAHINVTGGEGWGVPVFEAAACKVPQILPDIAATAELWDGMCIKLTPEYFIPSERINTIHGVYSPKQIAGAILMMREDKTETEKMAKDSYEYAISDRFKWETIGKKMSDLFKKYEGRYPNKKSITVEY